MKKDTFILVVVACVCAFIIGFIGHGGYVKFKASRAESQRKAEEYRSMCVNHIYTHGGINGWGDDDPYEVLDKVKYLKPYLNQKTEDHGDYTSSRYYVDYSTKTAILKLCPICKVVIWEESK